MKITVLLFFMALVTAVIAFPLELNSEMVEGSGSSDNMYIYYSDVDDISYVIPVPNTMYYDDEVVWEEQASTRLRRSPEGGVASPSLSLLMPSTPLSQLGSTTSPVEHRRPGNRRG